MYNEELLSRMIQSSGFADFISTYNTGVTAALSIFTLIAIGMFALNVVKFVKSANNPMQRSSASEGMIVCGICIVILGGIDIFYSILVDMIMGRL